MDETGRPLRVGLIGAGQMGRGFAAQAHRMAGVSVVAVVDVMADRAVDALHDLDAGKVRGRAILVP